MDSPDLEYAFSPSLTSAYFWGTSLLKHVGFSVGYSPNYDFTPDADNHLGAWNYAIVIGVYVPFIDFN